MPVNPSVKPEMLNNPTQRANSLNDPQFSEQQGYFPYDLSHGEYITPRFGEGTPTMHLDTVPADRFSVNSIQYKFCIIMNGKTCIESN